MSSVTETPALVLGSGITALGVIRTLGRAGIPTFLLTGPDDLARRSRWFRPAPAVAGTTPDELADYLAGCTLDRAVLFPCSDSWAMQAAALDAGLAERFPSSLPGLPALEVALDKAQFAEVVRAAALPHPRTEPIDTAADLDRIPGETFETAFLKPRDSQQFFRRFNVKAFRVHSRSEAGERLQDIHRHGLDVVLQEYIPGPASNHYFVDGFVDGSGRIAALFARRRLRMYPPDFGNSSYMVSVPLAAAAGAVRTIESLVERIAFRGMFSAEFKLDPRDGLFKILEVNARPWWYVEFAARCGVDVCGLAYRDALGLPVEPVTAYAADVSCCYPYYDFFACRTLWKKGELSVAGWVRSWLLSYWPVFRWDDPMPAMRELRRLLYRNGQRVLNRTAPPDASRPAAARPQLR